MEKVIVKCVELRYDFKYEDNKIIIDNFTCEIATIDQMSIMHIVGQEKLSWYYDVNDDKLTIFELPIK